QIHSGCAPQIRPKQVFVSIYRGRQTTNVHALTGRRGQVYTSEPDAAAALSAADSSQLNGNAESRELAALGYEIQPACLLLCGYRAVRLTSYIRASRCR